jgi:hypothetical protein
MTDVPVEKCPYCESENTFCIGHPKNGRIWCVDCKAQKDKGKWYTMFEWEIQMSCGCCAIRDGVLCQRCTSFEKWQSDNMDSPPLPEGWLPPAHREKGGKAASECGK